MKDQNSDAAKESRFEGLERRSRGKWRIPRRFNDPRDILENGEFSRLRQFDSNQIQSWFHQISSRIRKTRKSSVSDSTIRLHRQILVSHFNTRQRNSNSTNSNFRSIINKSNNASPFRFQLLYLSILSRSFLKNFSLSSSVTLKILSMNVRRSSMSRFRTSTCLCRIGCVWLLPISPDSVKDLKMLVLNRS